MTLTQEQLVECLEPFEKRYGQDYSDHEREIFFSQYSWMTNEMWRELCGLVLARDFYRIPAKDDFVKIQQANLDKFRRIRKVREPCGICNGAGTRMFLQKRRDGKHAAPAARCECRNGAIWLRFPSVAEAEKLAGFVRWIGHRESDFGAVASADLASGTGGSGDGADDKVPF